jgi:predicted aspartyl protease
VLFGYKRAIVGLNRQRIFRGAILVVGLALTSGTGGATPTCTLTRIEEWSVRSVNHYPVIDGTANGQPIGVMLDTGSTRSLILHSAAQRLDLPRRQARGYRMFGVGGESPVEIARVESFAIGQTVRKGWQLMVAGAQELAPGVDVILGDDFFHSVDVEFDLAHSAVRLFQAKDCDGVSLAYWTTEVTGEVTIEAVHDSQPQILLPVKVNGRPVQALLDSGAPYSMLTKRDAAAAGLTPDSPGVVPVGRSRGLGTKSVDTWIGPIDTFTIGNENIRDTAILFGDLFKDATYTPTGSYLPRQVAGLQQMLLGVDFLRAHRVLIAHSQRKLYFSYVGGPVFQPRGALSPPPAPGGERDAAPPAGGG